MVIPDEGDVAGLKKTREELIAWWRDNKRRKPVYWILERLNARGYSTGDPSDVQKTAEGLLSALEKGTAAERYAARAALSYLLPDGDGIPIHFAVHDVVSSDEESQRRFLATTDYLDAMVRFRAYQFAVWDCHRCTWDPEIGRYVEKPKATEQKRRPM